jgi:hypothetical protein
MCFVQTFRPLPAPMETAMIRRAAITQLIVVVCRGAAVIRTHVRMEKN